MNCLSCFVAIWVCVAGSVVFADSPIRWFPPYSFDRDLEGLGLPLLTNGVTHEIIFDPLLSASNTDLGGNGIYEGVQYGMLNHDAKLVIYHDKFIVHWNSHATDENGPGSRVLARVGTFSPDRTQVNWGGTETLVEVISPPALVKSRLWFTDPTIIDENFPVGGIRIIDDRLYVNGGVQARNGWVNHPKYSNTQTAPVPAENWSDSRVKETGFKWGVGWSLGSKFHQAWKIDGKTIIPDSPMYCYRKELTSIEVTPGRFKSVVPSVGPYQRMEALADAPAAFQDDLKNGVVTRFIRYPKYASGTKHLAADGLNGLAHRTEFCRPDGKWVVIRDNALNRGHYYAALKDGIDDVYPPAYLTGLYGDAWADAGELPDGKCYIICNSQDRQEMFITVSADGINFDRTWLLSHIKKRPYPGIGKSSKPAGAQYFKSVVIGENLWIVYSIAKEQIGVTKVPLSSLDTTPSVTR